MTGASGECRASEGGRGARGRGGGLHADRHARSERWGEHSAAGLEAEDALRFDDRPLDACWTHATDTDTDHLSYEGVGARGIDLLPSGARWKERRRSQQT